MKNRNGENGGIEDHQKVGKKLYFIFVKIFVSNLFIDFLSSLLECSVAQEEKEHMQAAEAEKARDQVEIDVRGF